MATATETASGIRDLSPIRCPKSVGLGRLMAGPGRRSRGRYVWCRLYAKGRLSDAGSWPEYAAETATFSLIQRTSGPVMSVTYSPKLRSLPAPLGRPCPHC